MSNLSKRLKGFERRVRLVRAWRGLAMGACLGAGFSAVWAVLDWRSILYTEWAWMGALTGGCALVGAVAGYLLRISASGLAQSIDRRAGLRDRLTTAQERTGLGDAFDVALALDADARLAELRPGVVYPIRMGRWHAGAIAFGAVAAAVFVLGNTPIALGEQAKKDREELKKEGQTVERVTRDNFETPEAKQEMSPEEKRLADELRRFNRDLEKAHLSKEEAMQKSNELAQKADEMMKSAAQQAQQSLSEAQTAQEQMEKAALEKAGIEQMSPQMAAMPDGERQQRMDQAKRDAKDIQNRLNALKRQLDEIKRKLENKHLTPAERKALEAQKESLEKKIDQANKEQQANKDLQKALELSKEAQAVFQKMMSDPLYKQLMELQKKMAQDAQAGAKPGSGQHQLTDAEREEIKRQLEALAAQLKDDKAMKAYLEKLLEAMKNAKKMGRCNGVGMGLGGIPTPIGSSMGGNSLEQSMAGPGAPSEDTWLGESGHLHHLDKAAAGGGTTTTDVISGDQRPGTGAEPYVEIRAPSTVGNRTSVPYKDVLPSYEKRAESALNRQQIPKEHQKRVREYFDSLTGAGKH